MAAVPGFHIAETIGWTPATGVYSLNNRFHAFVGLNVKQSSLEAAEKTIDNFQKDNACVSELSESNDDSDIAAPGYENSINDDNKRKNLLIECPPYQMKYMDLISDPIYMTGKQYVQGISMTYRNKSGSYAFINLGYNYTNLDFELGHIDGKGTQSATFVIILDGEIAFSQTVTPEMRVESFSLPLNNAELMKFELRGIDGGSRSYAIVNMYIS